MSAIRSRIGNPRDYPKSRKFTGAVNWVELDLGKEAEDNDHFITPEERLRVAMALQ